jgi:hypothetical protein
MSEKGCATTAEDQNECAEQFGKELVTSFHNFLVFNWLLIVKYSFSK